MRALLRDGVFARAEIIDAELGWPRGLAIGRLACLYAKAQENRGKSVAKRRLILEWACVEERDGQQFLALCCQRRANDDDDDESDHIHILEDRGDGSYYIVGNPTELERIETFKQRASRAGKASGKVRAAKRDERIAAQAAAPFVAGDEDVRDQENELQAELQAQPGANSERASSATPNEPSSCSFTYSSALTVLPPKPPRGDWPIGDGGPSQAAEEQLSPRNARAALKRAASLLAARAAAARIRGADEAGAKAELGELGLQLIAVKWHTWEHFGKQYARVYHRPNETAFMAQLRDAIVGEAEARGLTAADLRPPTPPATADPQRRTIGGTA